MKPTLLSLLFLFIPKLVLSQQFSENDRIIYLDSTSLPAKATNFVSYRVIKEAKLDKEKYIILEYSKAGVLKMTGTSNTKEGFTREGQITYYYENGNIQSVTNYIKGRKNGKETEWYENGTKKLEGEYLEEDKKFTAKHRIDQFWDENGVQKVINGNGDYQENTEKSLNSEKGAAFGKIKNGFKDDVWQGWVSKPEIKYTETYKDGKLVSGKIVDKNNKEIEYDILERKPEPKNGIMEFYKYVGRNYKIPAFAKGISGKIYVTFIVDTDGKVIKPRVLRDLGYGTGEEAIRILQEYKDFIPGEQRGRKVKCTYSLPITIQAAR